MLVILRIIVKAPVCCWFKWLLHRESTWGWVNGLSCDLVCWKLICGKMTFFFCFALGIGYQSAPSLQNQSSAFCLEQGCYPLPQCWLWNAKAGQGTPAQLIQWQGATWYLISQQKMTDQRSPKVMEMVMKTVRKHYGEDCSRKLLNCL